jgi:TldD protein
LKDLLNDTVEKGLNLGASFCEVRLFEEKHNSIFIENSIAKSLRSGLSRGIGIRIIVGKKWGFASTNMPSKRSVEKSLQDAISGAKALKNQPGETAEILEVDPSFDIINHKTKTIPADVSSEEKVKDLSDLEKNARNYSKMVKDTFMSYSDRVTKVITCNSFGTNIEETTPRTYVSCGVFAKRGENIQTGFVREGNIGGYEIVDEIQPDNFSEKAAEKAVNLLDASSPPSGTYTTIVDPKVGGLLVHEAFGHNSEGDLVFSGLSIVSDKLGQKVASTLVTIIDDPTIHRNGHYIYDHEGIKAKPHLIVKDGILVGFLHSLESASKLGGEPEGSARSQSHHHSPIVRMSNTYFDSGDLSFEEILEDVNSGVYLSGSRGGFVDEKKGHFTCHIEQAWLIEKGELTEHLRNVSISGLTLNALNNITAIGKDLRIKSPGTCGKMGQSVPVDGGSPHMRIEKIVVGGSR